MTKRDGADGHGDHDHDHPSFWVRWRKNFLTGLVVIAPLYLTVWLIWSVVGLIDAKVATVVPAHYNLQTYYDVPGYGLVVFVLFAALVGAIAKNLFAARLIRFGEGILDRLPIVRSVYNAIKQIAETVLVQSGTSFKKACLIEYPRKGLWAVAFVSTETRGEIRDRAGETEMLSVFLPTTPNPTSGFLLFVPRADVIELDMSVEDAAKLIISAGLVVPPSRAARPARQPIPAKALAPAAE